MNMFRRKKDEVLSDDVQIQEIEERHSLAQQVFFRREEMGLTQEKLADSAGMTQAQIAQIEAGHANPTHRTLVKLAAALRCRVSDLYTPYVTATQQDNCTATAPSKEFHGAQNRIRTTVYIMDDFALDAAPLLGRYDFKDTGWRPGASPASSMDDNNTALAIAS